LGSVKDWVMEPERDSEVVESGLVEEAVVG
jgi:hypothetical protein